VQAGGNHSVQGRHSRKAGTRGEDKHCIRLALGVSSRARRKGPWSFEDHMLVVEAKRSPSEVVDGRTVGCVVGQVRSC